MADPLIIAKHGDLELGLLPGFANRHGLITGATGTGKTVTLQVLAERLSSIGVPVFMADVKGDLAGMSQPGATSPKFEDRLRLVGVEAPLFTGFPTVFWDVSGEQGHPVRATASDLGPLLWSRVLELNDTQTGVLTLAFKFADDNGLLLLDLKDLRALLAHVSDNASQLTTTYGNVSAASIGAIQRGLLTLEQQGGDRFVGEPMLNVDDLLQTSGGRGVVNVLAADRLLGAPKLYSTVLLWLLSELYERLPEIGDPEKPKLVFFFDEAHLLFTDAPKILLDKIEQVVRLVRSKGVGVYFVTQNPSDEKGRPNVVERAYVLPPASRIGPISADERRAVMTASPVKGVYEQVVDRESAYEKLKQRTASAPAAAAGSGGGFWDSMKGSFGGLMTGTGRKDSIVEAVAKSAARTVGSTVGREIVRGVLGSLLGGRRR
jgi:DNA helicase HerA-like ATPase